MYKNPDGLSIGQTMAMYCRNHSNGYIGVQDYKYLYQYYKAYPAAVDAIAIWSFEGREDSQRNKVTGYATYYTEDEKELVDDISVELSTYVKEMRAKFIYGEADIDNDTVWADYLKQVEKLRADQYVDIVEGAMNKKIAAYAEYGIEIK